IVARGGATFTVGEVAPEIQNEPNAKPRVVAAFAFAPDDQSRLRSEVALLLGESSDVFWGSLYGLLHVPIARVSGSVGGATGRAGAVDPTFGHDFRSSGAGPLVDVRSGEVRTKLAPGRYRVSAVKGLEWSIDSEVVDLASGNGQTVELRPRHVVPTPGLVGCD